jgi:hypothetical protein
MDAEACGFDGLEDVLGLLAEDEACGSEFDGAASALEELNTEIGFEGLDLRAQRGLGEMEASRGLDEAEQVGDGAEGTEVSELHGSCWVVFYPGGKMLVER